MLSTLLLMASVMTAYLGFAYFALSQQKNLRAAMDGIDVKGLWHGGFRIAGSVLLAASLPLCILRDGPSFGTVAWAVVISVAATAVALTLTFRARLLRVLIWRMDPDEGAI